MDFVKIYNACGELEAGMIESLLKGEGIASYSIEPGTGGYQRLMAGFSMFGRDIYVREEDAEAALDIIADINKPEVPAANAHLGQLRTARPDEYEAIRQFYWDSIELMKDIRDSVGWKKGIYPSDGFIQSSIENNELYVLDHDGGFAACVILNGICNNGYDGVEWGLDCADRDVLIPHALCVHPALQGRGYGSYVVEEIIDIAVSYGKKTVRLDVLSGNAAAERLYLGCGFRLVETKDMYYEDTGFTEFGLFELIL